MDLDSVQPIFVVGCPRSGNTLVGCILNKHPDLVIHFEQSLFRTLYRRWLWHLSAGKRPPTAFVSALREQPASGTAAGRLEIAMDEVYDAVAGVPPSWAAILDGYMRLVTARSNPSATRWGDKTPHHVGHMRQIQQTYPGAQFVYVYRDPRDTAASLSRESFPHAANSPIVCAEIVAHYHRTYVAERMRIDSRSLIEVRYEELLARPEVVLRHICEFLQVDYSEALLRAAPSAVREAIGWPDYKGWGELARPAESHNVTPGPVEAYLRSLVKVLDYGYSTNIRAADYLVGFGRGLSFRMVRGFLGSVRKVTRRQAGPFFLNRPPSLQQYRSWLG